VNISYFLSCKHGAIISPKNVPCQINKEYAIAAYFCIFLPQFAMLWSAYMYFEKKLPHFSDMPKSKRSACIVSIFHIVLYCWAQIKISVTLHVVIMQWWLFL